MTPSKPLRLILYLWAKSVTFCLSGQMSKQFSPSPNNAKVGPIFAPSKTAPGSKLAGLQWMENIVKKRAIAKQLLCKFESMTLVSGIQTFLQVLQVDQDWLHKQYRWGNMVKNLNGIFGCHIVTPFLFLVSMFPPSFTTNDTHSMTDWVTKLRGVCKMGQ